MSDAEPMALSDTGSETFGDIELDQMFVDHELHESLEEGIWLWVRLPFCSPPSSKSPELHAGDGDEDAPATHCRSRLWNQEDCLAPRKTQVDDCSLTVCIHAIRSRSTGRGDARRPRIRWLSIEKCIHIATFFLDGF